MRSTQIRVIRLVLHCVNQLESLSSFYLPERFFSERFLGNFYRKDNFLKYFLMARLAFCDLERVYALAQKQTSFLSLSKK